MVTARPLAVLRLLGTLALTSAAIGCATEQADEPQAQNEGAVGAVSEPDFIDGLPIRELPPFEKRGNTEESALPREIRRKLQGDLSDHDGGSVVCTMGTKNPGSQPTIGSVTSYSDGGFGGTYYAVEILNPKVRGGSASCSAYAPGRYGKTRDPARIYDREIWIYAIEHKSPRRVAIGQAHVNLPAAWFYSPQNSSNIVELDKKAIEKLKLPALTAPLGAPPKILI